MPDPLLAIEQILSILEESPARIGSLTRGRTDAELQLPPEPGEWSVTGILAHVRSCCDMWGDAIESIVADDHPTIRAVNPLTWIESTDYRELEFSSSFRAFTTQRDHLLGVLRNLPAQDWSRSATVVGAGKPIERSVHTYAHRLAKHERVHWKQVAKTVSSLPD